MKRVDVFYPRVKGDDGWLGDRFLNVWMKQNERPGGIKEEAYPVTKKANKEMLTINKEYNLEDRYSSR